VNDFKSEKLYVVNFIHSHSIGLINKIMWGKYYTVGCSATFIPGTTKYVAITITRRQTTLLQDRTHMLVRNDVSFVSDNCLQSVRHRTDEILHSAWSNKLISETCEYDIRRFECR